MILLINDFVCVGLILGLNGSRAVTQFYLLTVFN